MLLSTTTIAAPTDLTATIEADGAFLSWQDVAGANGYIFDEAPGGTGKFVAVDHSLSDFANESNLQPTRRYDFRVRAVAQDGTVSAPSAIATVVVPLDPPNLLAAGAVSSSSINLRWDLGDDPPSSIEIDRSTDGFDFARIALLPPGTLQYTDNNLSEGAQYYYQLRAIRGDLRSDWAATGPDGVSTLPATPVGLTARAANTGDVDLTWRNVSDHAQNFYIYRSDDIGSPFDSIGLVSPPANTYRDTGLDANHTYRYYVTSQFYPVGLPIESSPSNIVTVTTPPAGVSGLGVKPVSTSEIDLSWSVAIRGVTGIEVDISADGQTYRRAATLSASARSFRSTGLSPDTHYWYAVRTLGPGVPTAFTPIDAYTLAPSPSNLRAQLDGPKHVQLTWRSNDPPGTVFEIERAEDPSFSNITCIPSNGATSYRDAFDSAGETFWYRVVALNANDNPSAPSNVVSITSPSPWPGTFDTIFAQGGVAGELFPDSYPETVAIAPDGKIVVSGSPLGSSVRALNSNMLVLARYNPDGTVDSSFATDGRLVTSWGNAGVADSLLVQPDGRIVVTGNDDSSRLVVARYLASGAPDPSFARQGAIVLDSVLAMQQSAVALQSDGKIVVAGVVQSGSTFSYTVTRLMPGGAPDPTFGSGGTVVTPLGSTTYGVVAVRVLTDGRIIVAGANSVVRYTARGTLDTSFGSRGFVRGFSVGDYPNIIWDVIAQPDGKLLVRSGGFVTRLLRDGTLDRSFGNQGTSVAEGYGNLMLQSDGTIVFSPSDGSVPLLKALTSTGAVDRAFMPRTSVAVPIEMAATARQPDGRIVAVGGIAGISGFIAVRFMRDGSFDPSFGYFGLSDVPDGLSGGVRAVAVQHDGKIVAAGNERNPDPNLPNEAGLVRYNPDGTLDTSFGREGRIYLRIGHETAFDTIAVEPNGDIVAGGSGEVRGVQVFVVARYLPSGFPDPTFGTNGVLISTFGHSPTQECTSLAVQGNGDIVAVGSTDHQIVVERLLPSGALDPHFGTAGVVMLNPGGGPASAGAMTLQSDGRIVIGGTINFNFGVIRLTPNGALDPTFGRGGVVSTAIAGGSSAAALVLDRQGRIVLGGTSGDIRLPTLARYLPSGRLDTTFGAGGIMRPTILSPDPSGQTVTNIAVDSQGRLIARLASLSLSLGPAAGTHPSTPMVLRLTDRGPDPDFGPGGATLTDPDFLPFGGLAIESSGKIVAGALGLWRLND